MGYCTASALPVTKASRLAMVTATATEVMVMVGPFTISFHLLAPWVSLGIVSQQGRLERSRRRTNLDRRRGG